MIRFVLDPAGHVTPDLKGSLPGRGAWVSARRTVLDKAVEKGAFSRALRSKAQAPQDLSNRVEEMLAQAALSRLGLLRRAGDVNAGFEKVMTTLKRGARALIIASDAGADGTKKMQAAAGRAVVVRVFDGLVLSETLGRNATYVALKDGAGVDAFLEATRRYEEFRDA